MYIQNNVYYNTPQPNSEPNPTETEENTPVQEVEPEQKQTLPFLVPEKLTELGTYSILEFEVLYHEAVKGGAPKLAKFIKHYRELKVLDTKGLNKKETFEQLKAFFGDELNYDYPNFTAYFWFLGSFWGILDNYSIWFLFDSFD